MKSLNNVKKLGRLSTSIKFQLLWMFMLWVVVVAARANLADVFSWAWYLGIAVGWALTIQLAWRARGAVEELDRG